MGHGAEGKNSSPHTSALLSTSLPISPSPHTSLREAAPTALLSTSLPISPSPHPPLSLLHCPKLLEPDCGSAETGISLGLAGVSG